MSVNDRLTFVDGFDAGLRNSSRFSGGDAYNQGYAYGREVCSDIFIQARARAKELYPDPEPLPDPEPDEHAVIEYSSRWIVSWVRRNGESRSSVHISKAFAAKKADVLRADTHVDRLTVTISREVL